MAFFEGCGSLSTAGKRQDAVELTAEAEVEHARLPRTPFGLVLGNAFEHGVKQCRHPDATRHQAMQEAGHARGVHGEDLVIESDDGLTAPAISLTGAAAE